MSVSFACECGRRFTARNEMRGKHVQCPTCSSLVPVPAGSALLRIFSRQGKASANRIAATSTLEKLEKSSDRFQSRTAEFRAPERRSPVEPPPQKEKQADSRLKSLGASPVSAPPFKAQTIRLRRRPKWTRLLNDQGMGTSFQPGWYHSVASSLVQAPTFLWMGLVLSILTAIGVSAWVSIDPFVNNTIAYQVFGFSLFFMSYVLATAMTYFNSVLALAARGKGKVEPRIVASVHHTGANCGVWIACFLTGPVLVFGGALAYWMYSGELDFVDWIILAELAFAGLAWWLFALLHTNASETFRIPFPTEVLRLAVLMRKTLFELVLPASLVFAGHILLAGYGLGRLQDQPLLAAALLSLFWGSGLYCSSFTLRRLGLAYCRTQRELRAALAA